jgi:hypothetical protein
MIQRLTLRITAPRRWPSHLLYIAPALLALAEQPVQVEIDLSKVLVV